MSLSTDIQNEFNRIGRELRLNFDVFPSMPGELEMAGFTNIVKEEIVVPVGPWAKDPRLKELGRWFLFQFVESGIQAYTLALFTRHGWSEEEVQVLLAKVKAELKRVTMHLYTYW